MNINNPNIKKGKFQKSLKNGLFPEKLVIKSAGNKNRIPNNIVDGKKNIPIRKKIKP